VHPQLQLANNFCLLAAVVPNLLLGYVKKAPEGRLFYSGCLSWLALMIMLYSWLAPMHYLPWVVFENEFLAFLSLILAIGALKIKGKIKPVNKYLLIANIILIIIIMQCWSGLISGQVAALGFLYVSGFALAAVAGENYRIWLNDCGLKLQEWILLSVLFAILLSACIVVAQWIGIEQEFPSWMALAGGGRAFGNLGQPNNQGTLLVTGVILVDLLWRKRLLAITSCVFFLLLLISAIAMTASRTSLLAAVLSGVYLLCQNREKRNRGFTFLWALAVPCLFVTMPWLKSAYIFAYEIQSARGFESLSGSPRIAIYSQLLKAVAEAPFFGFGWMQTAYAQSVSAATNYVGYETSYSHNLVLDLVLWFGLPIALLLVYFCICVIQTDYRAAPKETRVYFAVLIPFALHSALEFPFSYAFFLLPSAFILGFIPSKSEDCMCRLRAARFAQPILFNIIGVGGLFLGALVAIDYMKLAEDFRVLRFNSKNIGKIPDGFVMTDPMILVDMRDAFDVFVYKPSPNVDPAMLEKIRYAALREHWPSAHVKLISQRILLQDFEGARLEYVIFRNLYAPGIVSWGVGGLKDAYCLAGNTALEMHPFCELISE
jgi:hypothetical protein